MSKVRYYSAAVKPGSKNYPLLKELQRIRRSGVSDMAIRPTLYPLLSNIRKKIGQNPELVADAIIESCAMFHAAIDRLPSRNMRKAALILFHLDHDVTAPPIDDRRQQADVAFSDRNSARHVETIRRSLERDIDRLMIQNLHLVSAEEFRRLNSDPQQPQNCKEMADSADRHYTQSHTEADVGYPRYQTGDVGRTFTSEEDVKRRDFLRRSSFASSGLFGLDGLLPLFGNASAPELCNRLEATRCELSASFKDTNEARTLDDWHNLVHAYGSNTADSTELLTFINDDLAALHRQISEEGNDTQRRYLIQVAAQISGIIAVCLTDIDKNYLARRWWYTTKQLADTSGDTFIKSWARGWEAMELLYTHESPEQVIQLADEVVEAGGVIHGEIVAAKAQAFALLGRADEARAVIQSIGSTIAKLPNSVRDDEQTIFGWPEERLRHSESFVYSHVGDIRAAEQSQHRARQLYTPGKSRQLALINLHSAMCMAHDRLYDDACETAATTITKLDQQSQKNPFVRRIGLRILRATPTAHRSRHSFENLSHVIIDSSRSNSNAT